MTEQKNLPVVLLDVPVVLPGGSLTVELADKQNIQSVKLAQEKFDNQILVAFLQTEEIKPGNTLKVGVQSEIIEATANENDTITLRVILKARASFTDIQRVKGYYIGEADVESMNMVLTPQQQDTFKQIKEALLCCVDIISTDSFAINTFITSKLMPSVICDTLVSTLKDESIDLYAYLTDFDIESRLNTVYNYLEPYILTDTEINETVAKELSKDQKEFYIRKKINVMQKELGDIDNAATAAEELREKIKAAGMPENVEKQVLKELRRYQSTQSASPDSTMIRAYLDLMIELPWKEETVDNVDIAAAKAKLDETHFGLEKVKDRILEYLGVKLYTGKNPQTILCLAGAPGVGKTTLARSIADALGRKFVKQSMGGVKDEAEIRGHRRTYLGALPGRIINGIKEAGVINPVFLLDEIDKLGADYKGDPSAALLEVLDPAQNKHFMDHYTEVEYDLSNVMFICTANYLENIPAPLKDRMEIIELSSYTELEKFQIAKNYVVKRSLDKNGLETEKFEITDDAIKYLIKYYTREAGARQLERCMDSLVRKTIKKILSDKVEKVVITEDVITEMLGKKIYDFNDSLKEDLVGTVTGLAYTQAGGDTLQIECTTYKGKGSIQLTGKLGDVMKESAQAAYSWVKSHADEYSIDYKKFEDLDIHIHVPEGAVPKDGPSAGVTMTTALVSALTDKKVRHDLGMTGEITLRGKVLPIGGLKEKSIAAYRNGLKKILIPKDNLKDLEDIPQEVQEHLEIIPVETIKEVLNIALAS